MAVTPAPAVSTVGELAGIVDFEGPVVDASNAHPAQFGSDLIACIGTDQAMVDLVPTLVDAGCRVKVFEGQPRLILPDGLDLPRRAGVLREIAGAIDLTRRATRGLPLPAALGDHLAEHQVGLQRRSGSLHRRRYLHDRWLRRQLTPLPHESRPPLYGDGYYRALAAGRCQLISWPIARVVRHGVRTCDGLEHRVDAIVVAR